MFGKVIHIETKAFCSITETKQNPLRFLLSFLQSVPFPLQPLARSSSLAAVLTLVE